MTKNDKSEEPAASNSDAAAEDATFESVPEPAPEPEAEAEAQPEPAPEQPPVKKGGGIAWLALFVSVIALAAVGYTVYEDWQSESTATDETSALASTIASLGGRLESSNETLSNLDRGLADLGGDAARTAAELDALRSELEERVGLLDSLPPRVSTLEGSIATLQGVSAGARDTFLLAEAEYYMQIANAQLQLAGNPHLAALALGMADERIVQLANPGLVDVRRAISDELAALDAMDTPDIEGVTLTLASLSRVVDALPMKQADGDTADAVEADEELSGVDRAWNSVKGAMSELVKVTPPDQAEMPLIAPDAIQFLRANLALQLQTARLALLRGEKAVFEQSLDDAAAWIEQYFDTETTQVESALQTIGEIRGGLFAVAPPDISRSLGLLRQYRTLAETAP